MANEKLQGAATLENAEVENVNAQVASTEQAQSVAAPQDAVTIEEIVKRIVADGHSKVSTVTVTSIDTDAAVSKSGTSYINAWVTTQEGVITSQQLPDGTRRMGMLGRFQTPFNQIGLVMRKHPFYGRYMKYVDEAAEVNMAGLYIAGCKLKVLSQFIPAGVEERNPFTRKDNVYAVEAYDRYVHHIIGIDQCNDPITLQNYTDLNKQIMADAREALLAKRKAKAAVNSLLSATPASDMPF